MRINQAAKEVEGTKPQNDSNYSARHFESTVFRVEVFFFFSIYSMDKRLFFGPRLKKRKMVTHTPTHVYMIIYMHIGNVFEVSCLNPSH